MTDPTPDQMSDEELIGYYWLLTYDGYEVKEVKAEILRRMDPERRARLEAIEKHAESYVKLMDLEEAYDATGFPQEDRKKVYDAKWEAFDNLRAAIAVAKELDAQRGKEGGK